MRWALWTASLQARLRLSSKIRSNVSINSAAWRRPQKRLFSFRSESARFRRGYLLGKTFVSMKRFALISCRHAARPKNKPISLSTQQQIEHPEFFPRKWRHLQKEVRSFYEHGTIAGEWVCYFIIIMSQKRIRLTFSMKQRANKFFASSSSKFPLFESALSSRTPITFLTPGGWPKRRHLIFFFNESTWPVWYVCSSKLTSSSNDSSSWTYGIKQRPRQRNA